MIPKYIVVIITSVFIISGIVLGSISYFAIDLLRSENADLNDKVQNLGNQISIVKTSIDSVIGKSKDVEESVKKLTEDFSSEKTQDDLLTEAVEKVAPAVVSIIVSKNVSTLAVTYVNPFGDNPAFKNVDVRVPVYKQSKATEKQVAAASGFIIRSDGYILTNSHVVDTADTFITVLMPNGKQEMASIIHKDPAHDIAIIKVVAKNLPTVSIGDSGKLKLGQTVIAIGNALGTYNNSVSTGIISGLNREISAEKNGIKIELKNVIQTDAAINKGNSGGPLISLDGKVIGINVATATSGEGIGFSIPSNTVKEIMAGKI